MFSFGQNNNQVHIDSVKLSNVNTEINGFRTKIEWVKSNPAEDSIAVAQDWYTYANDQLAQLFDTKRQIIKSLNGKHWISKEEFEALPEIKKQSVLQDSSYEVEQN